MKQNKKTLKIKNKKIILEIGDTYDPLTDMAVGTVADVAKFAVSSAKFWKSMGKFLVSTGWYTFRAKVLNNMSKEEYKDALENVRVDFLNKSDSAVQEIDSNVSQMLSKAGIPESAINSYLLGFPGFSIIESIDASNLLSGRKKRQYTNIDPINKDTVEMIIIFMFVEIYPKYKGQSKITESIMTQISNEKFYKKNIVALKRDVPKFLNNIRKIDLSIIEKIKKTKSQKVLDFLRKSMKTSLNLKNHYATIAQDKKNAEKFLTLLKSKLSEFKVNENMTKQNSLAGPLLSISNKKISLIKEDKEDIELDEWNVEFVNLIRSISVSILHVNKEISDLVIEDFKSNTEKELENLKSDLDLEKDKANQEGKLGFLEKFVCSMGFEVYYFLAEIEFLNKLPNSVEKSFNVSSFEDYLTKAYKDKLGSNTAVFEPLKKAITDFIKKRAANKFNAKLSTKFDEIQKESEDKTKTAGEKYGDQKEAIKLIEKEKNIKLKIELFAFIEEYYKIIKEEFEKQNSFSISDLSKSFKPSSIFTTFLGA